MNGVMRPVRHVSTGTFSHFYNYLKGWQSNGKNHPLFLYTILPEISTSKCLGFAKEGQTLTQRERHNILRPLLVSK
jgi:hypothetical protein